MSPADLHAATLERLRGLSTINVHDSTVPDSPSADSDRRVFPYAVVWPVPGSTPEAARNLEFDPGGSLMWDARVTVASGDPTWTLQALGLVRARLEGWRPVPGSVLGEVETGGTVVLEDETTRPVRWFVPLQFRTYL